MNPTTAYHLGHARLAELHRQARRDELASAARRARRLTAPATGRPAVLTRWIHRLGGVSVS
jgi:hypothetical protein